MIRVHYRVVYEDGTLSIRWYSWRDFFTEQIAIMSLLEYFYPEHSEATEKFRKIGDYGFQPVYAVDPKEMHFCFLIIPDNPWHIGLNDV